MKTILLVMFFGGGTSLTMSSIQTRSFEECRAFGNQWVEKASSIHPDFYKSSNKPSFYCIELNPK